MRPEPCKVQGSPALYVVPGGMRNEIAGSEAPSSKHQSREARDQIISKTQKYRTQG